MRDQGAVLREKGLDDADKNPLPAATIARTVETRGWVVSCREGLHVRSSSEIQRLMASVNDHKAEFKKPNGERAQGDSIISMLMIAASKGTPLEVTVTGNEPGKIFERLLALQDEGEPIFREVTAEP